MLRPTPAARNKIKEGLFCLWETSLLGLPTSCCSVPLANADRLYSLIPRIGWSQHSHNNSDGKNKKPPPKTLPATGVSGAATGPEVVAKLPSGFLPMLGVSVLVNGVGIVLDSRQPKLRLFLEFSSETLHHASLIALLKRFELSVHDLVPFVFRV